ncbi:phage major capsid protein [Azospirillum sp.]|uniref:phage major capsid protein n=1 Tax=Azospirillum sp. TaxID=34012 RepID=UPI002D4EF4C8|nr:phage major capsid protein [Azospirillum sp.]HYF87420.1 phage major capsid protein [Azospirillum sp.]
MQTLLDIKRGSSLAVFAGPAAPHNNPTNPVELVAAIGTAFEEFKAANDQRLAEIEKGGQALPETLAKVDKINAAITELQAALDKQAKDIGRLTVGGGNGDPQGNDLRNEARLFIAARTGKPVEAVPEGDVERYNAYTAAFLAHVRRGGANGELLPEGMRNELSYGSDPDGGLWVPASMDSNVRTRLFETSPVRSIADNITITTDAYEFPYDKDEASTGGWVSEKDSRSETGTPQVGSHRIPVHEQYAEPHITQRLLDDAAVNVEAWLSGKIADKLIRVENTAFVLGDGVGKPRGFLSYGANAVTTKDTSRPWGKLQYIATGKAGGFADTNPGDKMIDLVHALHPAYRTGAVWTMNRATVAEVRKLKDGDGNYLWSMGNIAAGQPQSLLGYGIEELEDMPDIAANAFPIGFGNFKVGYIVVDRQGIRVLRDPYTDKRFVKFYTTKRVGGDVQNFDAIKLLKFAAS